MRERLPFYSDADFAAIEKEGQPIRADAVQVVWDYLQSQADGPAQCKLDARDAGRAILAIELLESQIRITPENLAKAKQIADMLEGSVEDYVNQTLSSYLDDVFEGRFGEIELTTRNYDTKAEAKRIIKKADIFDGKVGRRKWFVSEAYKPKCGKFEVEYEIIKAGKAVAA